MGFPHLGVLSASLTAREPSGRRHFMGLFDLTSSACTHRLSLVRTSSFNRMPWMRTPETAHASHRGEPCTSAFPVERVGRLFRSRSISRLLTPFICIPAYGFPVYASQWVLPPAHARLGTWLLARLCHGGHLRPLYNVRFKAQRSSNRTCGSPASGSRTEPHAFTHDGPRPSCVRRTRPKYPYRCESG